MPVMVLAVLRNGNHSQVKKVEIESDITTSTMIYETAPILTQTHHFSRKIIKFA